MPQRIGSNKLNRNQARYKMNSAWFQVTNEIYEQKNE